MNLLIYRGINFVFRLHNYVYKIGRSNSMLYNSANNQWYMLDEKCNEILDLCENNTEIER